MDFYAMCLLIVLATLASNICASKNHRPKKEKDHHHGNAFCFSEEELNKTPSRVLDRSVAHRMHLEKQSAFKLVATLEDIEGRRKRRKRNQDATCPKYNLLEESETVEGRSISPWTYRIDFDENRYPPRLAFAQCLCEYCISAKSGKETTSLNSVPITQQMLVLRKKSCPHDRSLWTFVLEYLSVPVGCTCVVPRYQK